jgi:hypothetical protein
MRLHAVPRQVGVVYRDVLGCVTPWGHYFFVIHLLGDQEVATFARRRPNGTVALCAGLPAAFAAFPDRVSQLELHLGIPIAEIVSDQFCAGPEPPRRLS